MLTQTEESMSVWELQPFKLVYECKRGWSSDCRPWSGSGLMYLNPTFSLLKYMVSNCSRIVFTLAPSAMPSQKWQQPARQSSPASMHSSGTWLAYARPHVAGSVLWAVAWGTCHTPLMMGRQDWILS